jgi:hypothetical protein
MTQTGLFVGLKPAQASRNFSCPAAKEAVAKINPNMTPSELL